MPTLKDLEETANQLAVDLMKDDVAPCRAADAGCVRREEVRPLTTTERKQGWARRPFYAYEPCNMCDACAAYWHASMARICLLDLQRRKAIAAGEARRIVENRKS